MGAAPGKTLIKVSSILCIVVSAWGFLWLFLAPVLVNLFIDSFSVPGVAPVQMSFGDYMFGMIRASYYVFMGIMGLRYCVRIEKANFLRVLAIIGLVLALILSVRSMILLGQIRLATGDFATILSALYLVGASQNCSARKG